MFGKHRLVRMMNRQHGRRVDENGERDAGDIVEVQHIDRLCGIANGPAAVVGVLEVRRQTIAERPLGVRVSPFHPAGHPRIAVGVDGDLVTSGVEAAHQVRNK